MAEQYFLPTAKTCTILSGATVSDAVLLNQGTVLGVQTPAALTGTEFTFQGSIDGTNYFALYDGSGLLVSIYVGASRSIPVDPDMFRHLRSIKVVSGTAEGADRVITLSTRIVR